MLPLLLIPGSANAQSGARRRIVIPRTPVAPATTPDTPSPPPLPPLAESRAAPLAADGADVVHLRESGTVQRGESQHGRLYDGQIYRFANSENRATFDQQPEQFAPVLQGGSVVAWVESAQFKAGDPRWFRIHKDRLYLFADAAEADRFDADPDKYANADLLLGGTSPVSIVDQHQLRDGSESFVVHAHGRRIHLADQAEREKFLAQPWRYYPVLDGVDPVSVSLGVPVFGQPRFAVAYQDRLYVFTSRDNRNAFIDAPQRYANIDVFDDGWSVVSRVETQRQRRGHFGISVIHRGRRYLFVDVEERNRFLEDPPRYDAELGRVKP